MTEDYLTQETRQFEQCYTYLTQDPLTQETRQFSL